MLEIRDLIKVYPGPVSALQGIDLELREGMFGLLGPNGAGKTTLMQIIAGILEPTSGRVRLDGVDITESPEYVWERLGYLPQDFGFYAHLTGRQMLAHLLRLKGVRGGGGRLRLCEQLLERVNLGDVGRRKVGGYSGGMLQRLGIAQAIAGDPRVLIVDEPTAGLDPEERQRFYHLLSELARNRIVLLSTHIVEDVSVLCERFAIIREGRLMARTTPREAVEAIAGEIWEGPVEEAEIDLFAGEYPVLRQRLAEGRSRVRILLRDREPPEGFEPVEATLEDAYLTVMRVGSDWAREAPATSRAGAAS